MSYAAADVFRAYQGSDADRTIALYNRLTAIGPVGELAVNLLRASKASERAKVYRGGGFRGMAYDKKQWAMGNLCQMLEQNAAMFGMAWGWGVDLQQPVHRYVLYVEIPTGQVSFHTDARGAGPNYGRPWDGIRDAGAGRICTWAARLLDENR